MTQIDPIWLPVAFALGFVARFLGLPPLVGFLVGGFVLHATGFEQAELIEPLADIGVTLLLFTIGLKLRVHDLTRPEVWAGTTIQMAATMAVFVVAFAALGAAGVGLLAGLDSPELWLIAFGLGFSSTVFAVKILEERGEVESRHGTTAVGMLIMQDVIAVAFLAASTGKLPSPWAVLLLGLPLLRPVLAALLDRAGHGELLILLGFLLALGLGHAGFEAVGVKGDLGALLVGMLLAPHPKAKELARTLLGFKDLLLVGFFLSIGLRGLPDAGGLAVALLLAGLVLAKVAIYFAVLTRFRLRARTAFLSSLSLANYSEFGLIVAAVGVRNGWLGGEWLVVMAIALSISLVLAAPLNTSAHRLYERLADRLRRFQTRTRLAGDEAPDVSGAEIAVFGMGRIGTSAYDVLRERFGDVVVGFDSCERVVASQQGAGRCVHQGDPTDHDFWEKVRESMTAPRARPMRLVLLAMGEHTANLTAASQMRRHGADVLLAATARYEDELAELDRMGVALSCNVLAQAGTGFAELVSERLQAAPAGRSGA